MAYVTGVAAFFAKNQCAVSHFGDIINGVKECIPPDGPRGSADAIQPGDAAAVYSPVGVDTRHGRAERWGATGPFHCGTGSAGFRRAGRAAWRHGPSDMP